MAAMEANTVDPMEAFAEANHRETLKYLRSLTLDRAAKQLERIYQLEPEFRRHAKEAGVRFRRKPIDEPWLSVLLADPPAKTGK